MSRNIPQISVVIPVHNGATYLRDAIDSVPGEVSNELEVIVVDDGSTDATAAVTESFAPRVRYVYQANRGPAAARNHGLRLARGELIGFLDADDLWVEGRMAPLLQLLAEEPAADLVMGHSQRVRNIAPPGEPLRLESFGSPWKAFSFGAGLFRRGVFDAVGSLDEDLRYGEDVDWFQRACEAGRHIIATSVVTQLYRRHEHNMTRDTARAGRSLIEALKKSIDRRRAADGSVRAFPDLPSPDDY